LAALAVVAVAANAMSAVANVSFMVSSPHWTIERMGI
jgi:hypothetical protein